MFSRKPNAMKQKNAYPPNFIHSLDSVHMMLTALHCLHAGITFVSVHDCFWTHACDIPILNKVGVEFTYFILCNAEVSVSFFHPFAAGIVTQCPALTL